jgi:hypothetical protein
MLSKLKASTTRKAGDMLRPRTYPELLGKALVLEAQPFEIMVDDDEPWVEGLVMVMTLGLLVGLARLIGGLLFTASLPPSPAVLEALANGWQQFNSRWQLVADANAAEVMLRQLWIPFTMIIGYGGGWSRLLMLVVTPLALLLQWAVVSLVVYGMARALGGNGTFSQTLGATALVVAPNALLLLTVIPFVAVSALLLNTWVALILYRAVEVAHDLPWQRASLVAIAPFVMAALLLLVLSAFVAIGLTAGGVA